MRDHVPEFKPSPGSALRARLLLVALLGAPGALTPAAAETPPVLSRAEAVEIFETQTGEINRPKEVGTYYEATVPDTLDLAERARLGMNHFLGILRDEPPYNYEMPFFVGYHPKNDKPVQFMHVTALGACQLKAMEAMVFGRLMTGSTDGLQREAKIYDNVYLYPGLFEE